MLEKGVWPFFLKQCLHVFEHGLTQGPLQNNLIRPLVGRMQVRVDLAELILQVEYLEIYEFVLYISNREKGPYSISSLK